MPPAEKEGKGLRKRAAEKVRERLTTPNGNVRGAPRRSGALAGNRRNTDNTTAPQAPGHRQRRKNASSTLNKAKRRSSGGVFKPSERGSSREGLKLPSVGKAAAKVNARVRPHVEKITVPPGPAPRQRKKKGSSPRNETRRRPPGVRKPAKRTSPRERLRPAPAHKRASNVDARELRAQERARAKESFYMPNKDAVEASAVEREKARQPLSFDPMAKVAFFRSERPERSSVGFENMATVAYFLSDTPE